MMFTDLEAGDRLLILNEARNLTIYNCACDTCLLLNNKITKEVEIIEVLEAKDQKIRVIISSRKRRASLWIYNCDRDKFEISHISGGE